MYAFCIVLCFEKNVCHTYNSRIQSFLRDKECDLQTSPPHFKSANGQVESDMKRLIKKCRTIMHENNAPANLWGFALRYSALILNYSPIRSNDWISPYELVFGEKPDYKCLHPFNCPGLYYVHKEERSSMTVIYQSKILLFSWVSRRKSNELRG